MEIISDKEYYAVVDRMGLLDKPMSKEILRLEVGQGLKITAEEWKRAFRNTKPSTAIAAIVDRNHKINLDKRRKITTKTSSDGNIYYILRLE